MITKGHSYILQYRKGGYLCRRAHFPTIGSRGSHDPAQPMVWVYWLTREPCEANRARNPEAIRQLVVEWYWKRDDFAVVHAPVCGVCGSQEVARHASGYLSPYRCWDHRDRNPCAIEGCTRHTSAARWLANNQWFCLDHWRRYCPPRSARRRAYLAFFRKAKRLGGWPPDLERQFGRFWNQLIRTARSKAEDGSLDKAAIDRMFGWGDEDSR